MIHVDKSLQSIFGTFYELGNIQHLSLTAEDPPSSEEPEALSVKEIPGFMTSLFLKPINKFIGWVPLPDRKQPFTAVWFQNIDKAVAEMVEDEAVGHSMTILTNWGIIFLPRYHGASVQLWIFKCCTGSRSIISFKFAIMKMDLENLKHWQFNIN